MTIDIYKLFCILGILLNVSVNVYAQTDYALEAFKASEVIGTANCTVIYSGACSTGYIEVKSENIQQRDPKTGNWVPGKPIVNGPLGNQVVTSNSCTDGNRSALNRFNLKIQTTVSRDVDPFMFSSIQVKDLETGAMISIKHEENASFEYSFGEDRTLKIICQSRKID